MKKIFYSLPLILVMWLLSSCMNSKFLDETQTTDLDRETVFSDSTYTVGFLYEIYRDIGFEGNHRRFSAAFITHGGIQCACDEAEFKASSDISSDVLFSTGTINPVTVTDDAWKKCYENIRRVNVFLKYVDGAPLTESAKNGYKAEARFLRAWYYASLIKHYGGVPLIGDVIYEAGENIKGVRDSYAACVDYIVEQCSLAAKDLPTRYKGRDQGRIDAGSCMALKSRVLLYAASTLFNGSDYAPDAQTKALLGYPTYDKERWKDARDAAQALIATNAYELYVSHDDRDEPNERGIGYYWLFMASDRADKGAFSGTILEEKKGKGKDMVDLFQPPSRNGSGNGGYPYQEIIDAFPMKNGKAITDPESGYNPNNPYENRDPRFNNSITHDQTPLRNAGTANVPVNTFLKADGSAYDQDAIYTGTPTGYYLRKMQHRECAANYWIGTPQSRPIIRYAEILLNYAEASNEYSGPSPEIYTALTLIRERAGIEPGDDRLYGLKKDMTKEQMQDAIRLERQIELAFEGFRFWDVRRWMIADQTDNKTLTGMEIKMQNGNKVYQRVDVRKHVFRKAMYFWPIPYKEVSKSPEMIQNPYYN